MTSAEDAAHGRSGRGALPMANAVVVAFSDDTDAGLTHAAGRVEHLHTGRRAVFASAGELLACISALLADGRAAPDEPGCGPGATGLDGATQRGSDAPTAVAPARDTKGGQRSSGRQHE